MTYFMALLLQLFFKSHYTSPFSQLEGGGVKALYCVKNSLHI